MDRKEAINILAYNAINATGTLGALPPTARETKYLNEQIKALNMAIEALQEPERKWIPVSERLPKECETVIGVTDLNYYCIAVYCKQYGFRSMDVGVESDIIAWQPLPEPYKGGKD